MDHAHKVESAGNKHMIAVLVAARNVALKSILLMCRTICRRGTQDIYLKQFKVDRKFGMIVHRSRMVILSLEGANRFILFIRIETVTLKIP